VDLAVCRLVTYTFEHISSLVVWARHGRSRNPPFETILKGRSSRHTVFLVLFGCLLRVSRIIWYSCKSREYNGRWCKRCGLSRRDIHYTAVPNRVTSAASHIMGLHALFYDRVCMLDVDEYSKRRRMVSQQPEGFWYYCMSWFCVQYVVLCC